MDMDHRGRVRRKKSWGKTNWALVAVCCVVQGGVERVSIQLTSLFDELVRSRKKLMDAAQHPPGIHRAYTW